MTTAATRTRAAAELLARQICSTRRGKLEPSGNVPDGWIFSYEHKGAEYSVEIVATTLTDEDIEERGEL